MQVSVTEVDIKKGVRDSPCGCPVKRAIERLVGPCVVGWDFVLMGSGFLDQVELPDEARRQIKRYDNGGTMHPFTFEIDVEAVN